MSNLMIAYPLWFRRNGIYMPSQINNPRVTNLSEFIFPKDSIWHYLPETELEKGPSNDNILVKRMDRFIYIDQVLELTSNLGNPRKVPFMVNSAIMEYRRTHRKFKPIVKMEIALREPLNLLAVNYALATKPYRYLKNPMAGYNSWYNLQVTLWNKVNDYANITQRHQFIYFKLPNVLPGLNQLRIAQKSKTKESLKPFTKTNGFDFLDLWVWLGKHRSESTLSKVEQEHLDKVNIILEHNGKIFILNLGLINTWRKDVEHEETKGIDPDTLQLRFLVMAMRLVEESSVANTKTQSDEPSENLDKLEHDDIVKQLDEVNEKVDQEVIDFLEVLDEVDQDSSEVYDDEGNYVETIDNNLNTSIHSILNDYTNAKTPQAQMQEKTERLLKNGLISAGEYKRLSQLPTAYLNIKDPYGTDSTLVEAIKIDPKDYEIHPEEVTDIKSVLDKTQLKHSTDVFDKQYIQKLLKKNIIQNVLHIQNAGIAVTNYKIEKVVDAVSDYEVHRVEVNPIVGKPSTLVFRVPNVNKNGTFISNGVKYRMKKQRTDLPIRKISPDKVGLSSASNKLFIERSSRSTFNYKESVIKNLITRYQNKDNQDIFDLQISNSEYEDKKLPYFYGIVSTRIKSFKFKDVDWYFEYASRFDKGPFEDRDKKHEHNSRVLVGKSKEGVYTLDHQNILYLNEENLGKIDVHLDILNSPLEVAELKLFSKSLPVGMALSYLVGFNNLIKILNEKHRIVPTGERLNLQHDEYAVRFLDESYIFKKDSKYAKVFAGFLQYNAAIKYQSAGLFDDKEVYQSVFNTNGINVRYLKELDLMDKMFLDPNTKELLSIMGEPVEFIDLVLKATTLLEDRFVPKTHSGSDKVHALERVKGYERIAGAVYSEILKTVRTYYSRTPNAQSKLSMNNLATWINIVQDPSVALVEELNPVHNLKEKDIMTYGGTGGRSRRSMTAAARIFQKEDLGFVSEGTVDSGDVAIITYLTPNANISTVFGTVKAHDENKDGPSTLVSCGALLGAALDMDDPKRANFANIQQSHGIIGKGYRVQPYKTGYGEVIAHRCDDLFAQAMEQDGTVEQVDEESIVIAYKDGSKEAFQLGHRFGSAGGLTMRHNLVTNHKVGDKLSKGDIICYNEGWFEPSMYSKNQVDWKGGVLARTALMETENTIEDSSGISEYLAEQLVTEATKIKTITVDFDQTVHNLLEVGDHVDLDTILCVIEDMVTARIDLFDKDNLDLLKRLNAMTPKAKCVGVITKVEVYYNGLIEDMSESLKSIVNKYDRQRKRLDKKLLKVPTTGLVDESLRIDGNGLVQGKVAIRFYFAHEVPMGVGDKAVFGNQMKTVIGQVLVGEHSTESGEELDSIFGYKSNLDRIVLSSFISGTTNTLLRVIGEKASDIYFS